MPSQTVLVVDDSPTALRMVKGAVEAGGYRVLTAADGDEALEIARRELPDLVVLDIILPKKNGYQVCRQLKAEERTRDVKIVIVSSKSHEMDKLWGQRQGADAYVTKPFAAEELLDCLRTTLKPLMHEPSPE